MAVKKAVADALLNEAYQQYYLDIVKYCTVRLRENKSAVDDCTQEVFLVYYNKLLSGEEILKVRAFLYRTADNICKAADTKFIRQAKRSVEFETMEDVAAAEIDEKASSLDYDYLKEILVQELKPDEQELYILKYEQKKSLKEISVLLDISPNAVAKRTSRLRSRITDLVGEVIEEHAGGGVVL